jgi:putative hydrolase of the HAD superfamily
MKHFIFDMGGVLKKVIDNEQIENYDIGLDKNLPEGEEIVFKLETELMLGNITLEEFVSQARPYFNKKDITTEEYIETYYRIGKEVNIMFPHVLEYLRELKAEGHKVYLLSNLIEISFIELKTYFDVSVFDKAFLSYEMHMIKPNDDIYQAVIKEIGDDPSNMIFFDDNPKNVEAAIRNGMHSYVTDGAELIKYINQAKVDNNI